MKIILVVVVIVISFSKSIWSMLLPLIFLSSPSHVIEKYCCCCCYDVCCHSHPHCRVILMLSQGVCHCHCQYLISFVQEFSLSFAASFLLLSSSSSVWLLMLMPLLLLSLLILLSWSLILLQDRWSGILLCFARKVFVYCGLWFHQLHRRPCHVFWHTHKHRDVVNSTLHSCASLFLVFVIWCRGLTFLEVLYDFWIWTRVHTHLLQQWILNTL